MQIHIYTHSWIQHLTTNWGISVCVSVCVCVCLSVRLYISTFLNGSSLNLERTFYGSWHVSWAINFCSAHNARACACVLNARPFVHSLIFERIISKFAGNILLLTISIKDYVLFIFTHRAHACECACARACVIKHLLIYGPTLSKFAVNILQITTRAWLKHSLIFGRILFIFAGHILQMTTHYMGYTLIRFTQLGHLFMAGFSSNLGWTYYTLQQVARDTYFSSSRTARTRERFNSQ
jgi:hypothetical protein